jgi:hypothetical protein
MKRETINGIPSAEYHRQWKLKNPDKVKIKNGKLFAKRNKHYKELHKKIIETAGGKCVKCGFQGCDSAFDFHHLNKNEKEIGIAQLLWEEVYKGGNVTDEETITKALEEVSKCILICSNCHRTIHAEQTE